MRDQLALSLNLGIFRTDEFIQNFKKLSSSTRNLNSPIKLHFKGNQETVKCYLNKK